MFRSIVQIFYALLFGCFISTASQAADLWRNLSSAPLVIDPNSNYNPNDFDGYAPQSKGTSPMNSWNPTAVIGRDGSNNNVMFIRFDVSRLPRNATNVSLWYYVTSGSASWFTAHVVSATVVPQDYSALNYYSINSLGRLTVSNVSVPGSGWMVIDITSAYNNWKSGAWQNNGIWLGPNGSTTGLSVVYTSRYSGTDAAQYLPRLHVVTSGPAPFLDFFPLPTDLYPQGPYTPQKITSVLDHNVSSTDDLYAYDGTVGAYTGEWGAGTPVALGCYPVYNPVSSFQNVDVEGLYIGTSGCDRSNNTGAMNYDGHPGYDYKAELGTEVHAAAGGVIKQCVVTSSREAPQTQATCDAWGMLSIEHTLPSGEKYRTQYEHLDSFVSGLTAGVSVVGGQLIGYSGHTAPSPITVPNHFHFEVLKWDVNGAPDSYHHYVGGGIMDPDCVATLGASQCTVGSWKLVDPYGWNGQYVDSLEAATGFPNYRLWK